MIRASRGQTLVRGKPCYGIVSKNPRPKSRGYIFVTRHLSSKDYNIIRRCRGVICENGGATDHASVICRILGKPVILAENATRRFQEGEEITLDTSLNAIYRGKQDVEIDKPNQNDGHLHRLLIKNKVKFHLSIVDERDIARINKLSRGATVVEQFFVREELIWAKENIDPFSYLRSNGPDKTSTFLKGHLLKCLRQLNPGQSLNYRSLDLRSDQRMLTSGTLAKRERNPELGLHGIRRLLKEPGLLAAELKTVNALYRRGHNNLIFSLPFINDREEFQAVKKLASKICVQQINLGVFIETPAAVYELDYFLEDGANFIYVGTKDLTQTILACDRGNKDVRHLFDSRKRAVQAAIRRVVNRSKASGVSAALFVMREDIPFYLKRFSGPKVLSMCCSEYEDLLSLE